MAACESLGWTAIMELVKLMREFIKFYEGGMYYA